MSSVSRYFNLYCFNFNFKLIERKAAAAKAKFPKSLIKFNKTLTSKQLMQADLVGEDEDPNYRDKVARCLDWRVQKMRKRQVIEDRQWQKVVNSEKNYIMDKKGYKNMLQDLQEAKKNLSKFKRGLSVFEDEELRN